MSTTFTPTARANTPTPTTRAAARCTRARAPITPTPSRSVPIADPRRPVRLLPGAPHSGAGGAPLEPTRDKGARHEESRSPAMIARRRVLLVDGHPILRIGVTA